MSATMASGAPSAWARCGSGIWVENGIAVARRNLAISSKLATGSSQFLTSQPSMPRAIRIAVGRL